MNYNNSKLRAITKILKENKLKVKVGVLGDNGSRKDGRMNNATIGLFHEFGTYKMYARSFLRMPLSFKFNEYVSKAKGLGGAKLWETIYEERSMKPLLKKVGIIAERVVDDAFQTGGFGTWPDLHAETWLRKKNLQILIETGQLRRSITSEVK